MGDQPAQTVPAGDHHQAAGAAGQQRPHLLHAARVVQHHEQAPVGQQRAVQPGGLLQLRGDLLGRHAQRVEEPGERLDRPQQRGRRVAAQVDVQLPVAEALADPVGPIHRQRGLADPGAPRHRGDGHRAGFLAGRGQDRVEVGQFPGSAGERLRRHR